MKSFKHLDVDVLDRKKEAGFVPHMESVLHDVNYEETAETKFAIIVSG